MAKKERYQFKRIYMVPVILASVIIPLIVYMKRIKIDGILYESWNGDSDFGEFFSYYKSVILLIAAILAVVMIINNWRKLPTFRMQNDFIPAIIYIIFVIISTITSEYLEVALSGYNERYEGALALISYIIICFYTANFIQSEEKIKSTFVIMGVSCTIIGIIGLLQYVGYDPLQTTFGMKLILPKEYHQYADSIKFTYAGNIITGTLNNPNYVGSYSCMLLLITLGLFYYFKNTKERVIVGIVFCGFSFVLWIGSMSRAGLVGGILGIVILLIMQFKKILSDWKYTSGILIYFVIIYFAMNSFTGGRVVSEFNNINPVKERSRIEQRKNILYIEEITTQRNQLVVKTSKDTLKIEYNDGKIEFFDESNNRIESIYKGEIFTFESEDYSKYKLATVIEGAEYILNIGENAIRLNYDDNEFQYLRVTGNTMKVRNAETLSILDGREAFGSGRGFIWSRTIPMIKETIFIGHGPDTFAIYFPQWDLAGKINGLRNPNTMVDKPHNWYMQIAVNTGLLSMISIVSFILVYCYKVLLLYIKSPNKDCLILQSVTFSAVISYCIAGFFNDSVVAVSPVFWVILGLGIAHNREIKALL